jgi:hypothetical protein
MSYKIFPPSANKYTQLLYIVKILNWTGLAIARAISDNIHRTQKRKDADASRRHPRAVDHAACAPRFPCSSPPGRLRAPQAPRRCPGAPSPPQISFAAWSSTAQSHPPPMLLPPLAARHPPLQNLHWPIQCARRGTRWEKRVRWWGVLPCAAAWRSSSGGGGGMCVDDGFLVMWCGRHSASSTP